METLKTQLNEEQRAIAGNLRGDVLVVAGPGSGKTRLLVHRVAYELRKTPTQRSKVLVLTFTSEAARELQSRLVREVPRRAYGRVWCGNFHRFGQYLLRHYGHLIEIPRHFEVIDEVQSAEVLERALSELGIARVKPQDLAYTVSKFRNRVNMPTSSELGQLGGSFELIVERYTQIKAELGVLDFDDLIIQSSMLLSSQPHLQDLIHDVYKSIYVDELQDTSLLQLEFLKLLHSQEATIFAVADEDQMLYEWRDARLATIREYEQHFDARKEYLVQNYRSPQIIVDVANELIRHNQNRHDKELVSAVTGRSAHLSILRADTPDEEAAQIADQIRIRISDGQVTASQMAVLARIPGPIHSVLKALTEIGVPATYVGDRAISRSIGVRFVKCIVGVSAGSSGAQAMIARIIGLLEHTVGTEVCSPDSLAKTINCHKHLDVGSFVEAVLNEISLSDALDATNKRYLSIATRAVGIAALNGDSRDYASINTALTLEWNRLEITVLRGENSVKLMTIHQAKGLEFRSVFLPRLEEGVIPSSRSQNIPEERRLLFVAITRAMDELVLSLCNVNDWGRPSVPSRFLKEIPLDRFEELIV